MLLRWKIVAFLKKEPPIQKRTKVFKVEHGGNFYKRHYRLQPELCYTPYRFSPTIKFHRCIKKLLKENFKINSENKGYPYILTVQDVKYKLYFSIKTIRYYYPKILVLTAQLNGFPDTLTIEDYIKYQYLVRHDPINSIIQWTIGISESFDLNLFEKQKTFIFKPFLQLDLTCSEEEFQSHFDNHINEYIGILIRNEHYNFMSSYIPLNILKKNEQLNAKSCEKLLIDKQGILYLAPSNIRRVYSRTQIHDLCEIAMVIECYFTCFQQVRLDNEDVAGYIFFKLIRWIEDPVKIFSKSVSHRMVWTLMINEYIHSVNTYIYNEELISKIKKKTDDLIRKSPSFERDIDYITYLNQKSCRNKPDKTTSVRVELINDKTTKKRPLRAFLCYCKIDISIILKLYNRLSSNGISPWMDEKNLLPGQDWELEITNAVNNSDVIIICLSNNSIKNQGYIQKEIKKSLDLAERQPEGPIFIIPVKLEDCEVPEKLSRWHWLDLYKERGYDLLIKSLNYRVSELNSRG